MLGLAIGLLFVLAVIAVLIWAVQGITLAPPFNIIARVAVAVIALILLFWVFTGGVPAVHTLRLT